VCPLILGQVIQYKFRIIKLYIKRRKWYFNKSRECAIIYIVYTTFCKTFDSNSSREEKGATVGEIFLMVGVIGVWVALLMVLAWYVYKYLYRDHPGLRVFAVFGCTHKTISLGVPLIQALYENNTNLALFTLPILVWHPVELILGSIMAPKLEPWTRKEKKRVKLLKRRRSTGEIGRRAKRRAYNAIVRNESCAHSYYYTRCASSVRSVIILTAIRFAHRSELADTEWGYGESA